ncbi:MAG: phage replisome organizer N-terminal domain-containing protein [Clostridium sp.]|uniref:phage replisome organizer N-terminal domain-containing protein n=1 Tax=Clostridium sp. TaxID=1506 RepID=UPI002913D5D9|nr:phage replisome organizer N-terminal domain-containing protein [Clostridium sp.]MDU7339341.1 phage replisome organizer N-terminal domain-containing protein [Clostridium sp.]
MAEVKWIKIVTGIFDDEKICLIEDMPDADTVLVVWFKLLCLAGKTNNSGIVMLSDRIAYTDEMLAAVFRRPINTIRLALKIFEQYGMIEIIDGVIAITNWEKHQNQAKLETMREYNRLAKQEERQRKKQLLLSQGHVIDSQGTEIDIEEDKDKDIDKDIEEDKGKTGEKSPCPYSDIQNLYSSVCVSYPKVTRLSEARKKAIKARWVSGYGLDDFKALFEKAEASSFLKGKNDRNWQANFDWLIKDANMVKVLDGNYDNKGGQIGGCFTPNQRNNVATAGGNPPEVPKYGKIF